MIKNRANPPKEKLETKCEVCTGVVVQLNPKRPTATCSPACRGERFRRMMQARKEAAV